MKRPRRRRGSEKIEFSFYGMKTALERAKGTKSALAYEFQEAVTDVLISNFKKAISKYKPKMILVGGGVSANKVLREKLTKLAKENDLKLILPEMKYCTDNAAMIGAAAHFIRNPKQDKWYNAEVIL